MLNAGKGEEKEEFTYLVPSLLVLNDFYFPIPRTPPLVLLS
jgi:hypothetical protein